MIVIDTIPNIDLELYDEVWYPTCTNPGMRVGCNWHPEIGPSRECFSLWHKTKDEVLVSELYAQELEAKDRTLRDVVNYCKDKWVQMVCYEPNPYESDIYILYAALSKYTKDIKINGVKPGGYPND